MGRTQSSKGTKDIANPSPGNVNGGSPSIVGARRYPRYPAYKDSGVEWLGEIPVHWRTQRLRYSVTRCQNGLWGDDPNDEFSVACIRVADFDRVTFTVNVGEPTLRSVESAKLNERMLQLGDLLLEKSGGGENQPVGAVVQNTYEGSAICSNFVARMSVRQDFEARFLTYFHSTLYAARVNTRSIKQNTGIQNLDSESYLDEIIVFAEPMEQRTIAAFLDRETAKIDALVAKKERLLELMQEKRAALVTRAVIKGLDPDVSMKDSGVEWLGEIPVHWQTARTWQVSEPVSGGTPSRGVTANWGGSIPWVSPKDMKRRLISDTEERISELGLNESGLKLIQPPAVLVVVRGMILAHSFPVGLLTVPATINQDMRSLRLGERIEPRFFAWLLDGASQHILSTTVEKAGHGTRAVRMEQWRSIDLPIPQFSEQCSIADHLDRETAKIGALMGKIREAIDRLKELRTALISAAVTGKIDVRETAA